MNKTAVQTAFIIVLALLPLGLVFNDTIWFDEAYTLALIRHDYGEVLDLRHFLTVRLHEFLGA